MRYLLDTQTLLWALIDPGRLGPEALPTISNTQNQLMVSAASAWEISTKVRLGRLPDADAITGAYSAHLRRLQATHLPITDEHALLAGSLIWEHRDPFDRMLAAQAVSEGMPMITKDAAFDALRGLQTIW